MGAIPSDTLLFAKSLEEEQIQFKQNLHFRTCTIRDQLEIKMNFQKLELSPSNCHIIPFKNINLTMHRNINKLSHT